MKYKAIPIQIILLSFFCLDVFPQESDADLNKNKFLVNCDYNDSCLIVISKNGLKMRDSKQLTGKIITIIPFGEKVKTLEMSSDFNATRFMSDGLSGFWVKVSYKEKIGYVFSAFLGNKINKMTEPFYLIIPNGGCGSNDYFSATYRYYGFYNSSFKNLIEIKKITPIFYFEDLYYTVKADSCNQPVFIIASIDSLVESDCKSELSEINLFQKNCNIITGKRIVGLNKGENSLEVENFFSPDSIVKKLVLKNKSSGVKQFLAEGYSSYKLFWDGDLDNDGKTDFIIYKGHEHGGVYELYITTKATKGNLVKKIATYEAGDCC